MFKTFKIAPFIAATALLNIAPALAAPALAAPVSGQNVSIVSTADIDLSSAAGRAALDHRLVIAADEVCGTASDADLVGKNRARECRKEVLADARFATVEFANRRMPIRLAAAR
jgi:UrcA family protein